MVLTVPADGLCFRIFKEMVSVDLAAEIYFAASVTVFVAKKIKTNRV